MGKTRRQKRKTKGRRKTKSHRKTRRILKQKGGKKGEVSFSIILNDAKKMTENDFTQKYGSELNGILDQKYKEDRTKVYRDVLKMLRLVDAITTKDYITNSLFIAVTIDSFIESNKWMLGKPNAGYVYYEIPHNVLGWLDRIENNLREKLNKINEKETLTSPSEEPLQPEAEQTLQPEETLNPEAEQLSEEEVISQSAPP